MKRSVGLLALGIQGLACSVSAATLVDLSIGSDMAAVELVQNEQSRGSIWSLGLTRNDDADATTFSVGFNATGNLAGLDELRAGVGWKASYHDTFQSSYSLALGGSLRYEPATVPGLGVEAQAYIAPDVLATNDSERYQEFVARVTYDLHARATVFAGWSEKTLRFDAGAPVQRVEVADGMMAGFALAF